MVSKGLVSILNSSKKLTGNSDGLVFVHFFEELKTPKSPLEINWPLRRTTKGSTYRLAHFLGNFREKTKKVPTRTLSRKLSEYFRKFPKKFRALLPLAHLDFLLFRFVITFHVLIFGWSFRIDDFWGILKS